ncbi:hypothetical protein [Melittangium boletus]|nr:hypothetical protein [Melittangium boletus]
MAGSAPTHQDPPGEQARDDAPPLPGTPPEESEPSPPGRVLACADILPGEPGPGRSIILRANAREADCGPGTGDGAGSLALTNSGPLGATGWNIVSREGLDTGNRFFGGDLAIAILSQPRGFHVVSIPPGGATLTAYSSVGEFLRTVTLTERGNVPFTMALDPLGGTLVAQWDPRENGTQVLTFQFLDATGLPRTASLDVVSAPQGESRGVIAGVDTQGRALLLWREPGSSVWVGQWRNRDGTAVAQPFTFPAPASTFGGLLSPLAGGGLALRSGDQWVASFPSGRALKQSAPEWLASHPGSTLVLIRGQQANALVPPPTLVEGSGCQESLLFFATDGTACGELLLPFGGGSCFQRGLGVAPDGTVIQQVDLNIPSNNQCAWRWWPRLLR